MESTREGRAWQPTMRSAQGPLATGNAAVRGTDATTNPSRTSEGPPRSGGAHKLLGKLQSWLRGVPSSRRLQREDLGAVLVSTLLEQRLLRSSPGNNRAAARSPNAQGRGAGRAAASATAHDDVQPRCRNVADVTAVTAYPHGIPERAHICIPARSRDFGTSSYKSSRRRHPRGDSMSQGRARSAWVRGFIATMRKASRGPTTSMWIQSEEG